MQQSTILMVRQDEDLPSCDKLFQARSIAKLIDSLFIGIFSALLWVLLYKSFPEQVRYYSWNIWTQSASAFAIGFFDVQISIAPVIAMLFVLAGFPGIVSMPEELLPLALWFASAYLANWLYHAYLESQSGATLGMRIMSLRIVTSAGEPISFLRATLRHTLKPVNILAGVVPILHVVLGNRMQAIHDRIARVYVLPVTVQATPSTLIKKLSADWIGPREAEFAPFWRRAGSAVLDAIVSYSLIYSVFLTLAKLVFENVGKAGLDFAFTTSIATCLLFFAYLFAVSFVAILFALIEGSRLQSTLGKMVFGLKVVGPDGGNIDFFAALNKQFVQSFVYASLLPVIFLPLFYCAFYWKSTLGLNLLKYASPLLYGVYGFLLCVTLFRGRQTVVDKLSNRFIIVDRKPSSVIE